MEFTVSGRFRNRDAWQPFTSTVDAPNENVARERMYSSFGSKHGLKRRQVEIDEVVESEVVDA